MNQLVLDFSCVTDKDAVTNQVKLDAWDLTDIFDCLVDTVVSQYTGVRIDFDVTKDNLGSITISPADTTPLNIVISRINSSSQSFFPSEDEVTDIHFVVKDFLEAAKSAGKIKSEWLSFEEPVKEVLVFKQTVGIAGSVATDLVGEAEHLTHFDVMDLLQIEDKPCSIARTVDGLIFMEVPGEIIPGDGITPDKANDILTYQLIPDGNT